MSIQQKKCPECHKWTDGSKTHCAFCGALIDLHQIRQQQHAQRKEAYEKRQRENENALGRLINRLEASEKPLAKFSFKLLSVVHTVYMAILSFFIWLIALLSG